MIKLCPLASGSNGNCTYISDGKVNILVDTGISATRIIGELSMLRTPISAIDAIFITHEHSDHITGLLKICERTDAPIYASNGTARGIGERIEALSGKVVCIKEDETVKIGDLSVTPFHTPHDTYESMGYRINTEKECAIIATDIGRVDESLLSRLLGADILLLESNYDRRRLSYSRYPAFLKERIVGGRGHLSNDECASVALRAAEEGTGNIVLGHISAENNTPGDAYTAVHRVLTENGIIPGVDVMLYVAPRGKRGELVTVEK